MYVFLFLFIFSIVAMRVSTVLCVIRNRLQNPKTVPFQTPRLEFRLKGRISRINEQRAFPGIQETQNLITKLAENEYTGKFCDKEYQTLQKTNKEQHAQKQEAKARNRSKLLVPGGELSFTGTCRYLKKFTVPRTNTFEKSQSQSQWTTVYATK